jgi:hypothetical protein
MKAATPLQHAIEASGWTEEHARDINAILHRDGMTAIGAYCMGMVSADVYRATGQWPARSDLERAAGCITLREAGFLVASIVRRMKKQDAAARGLKAGIDHVSKRSFRKEEVG